jgi:hypothetical protein
MQKLTLCVLVAVSLMACQKSVTIPSTGTQAVEADWSASALYGSYTTNGYTLSNNMWGFKPGPQTLWVNSSSNWGVWSDQVGPRR